MNERAHSRASCVITRSRIGAMRRLFSSGGWPLTDSTCIRAKFSCPSIGRSDRRAPLKVVASISKPVSANGRCA